MDPARRRLVTRSASASRRSLDELHPDVHLLGVADDGGASAAISGIIGALTGQAAPADPLVRAAAAGALYLGGAGDGRHLSVLNHETDSFNIFLFASRLA